jgi:hypothetical protein
MRKKPELYTCGGTVLRRSEKAVLLEIEGEKLWIPFSQVERECLAGIPEDGAEWTVSMTEWIATQKGLI